MPPLLDKEAGYNSIMTAYANSISVEIPLPLQPFCWKTFVTEAKRFFGQNFGQFLMLLAGTLSAFHYEKMLKVAGKENMCCGYLDADTGCPMYVLPLLTSIWPSVQFRTTSRKYGPTG